MDTSSSPVTFTGELETLLARLLSESFCAERIEFGVDVFRGVDGEQLRSSRLRVEQLRSRGCSPVDFLMGSGWKEEEF